MGGAAAGRPTRSPAPKSRIGLSLGRDEGLSARGDGARLRRLGAWAVPALGRLGEADEADAPLAQPIPRLGRGEPAGVEAKGEGLRLPLADAEDGGDPFGEQVLLAAQQVEAGGVLHQRRVLGFSRARIKAGLDIVLDGMLAGGRCPGSGVGTAAPGHP